LQVYLIFIYKYKNSFFVSFGFLIILNFGK